MELSELTDFVEALGEKPFRARQLYRWMHAQDWPPPLRR